WITADATETPPPTPTALKLTKTDASQEDPAASYALSAVSGWTYSATVPEALAGLYSWTVEDAGGNVIESGYVLLADTAETYRQVVPSALLAADAVLDGAAEAIAAKIE